MKKRLRFIGAVIRAEWHFMFREPTVLLILVIIPLFYAFLISTLYMRNQPVERPMLLIDMDNSELSRRLSTYLEATQDLAVAGRPATVDEGFALMKRSEAELMVLIPPDFSTDIKRGDQATLKLWVNSANILTYGFSYPAVANTVATLNAELTTRYFLSRGVPRPIAVEKASPLRTDERVLFAPTLLYGSFLITGIFLIIIQQVILLSLASSVGIRRERDLRATPAPYPFTDLEARFFAHSGFYVAAIAFFILVIFPLFGWPVRDPGAMILLFAAFSVALAPAAIAIAAFMPDRTASFQILMFVSTPLYLVSGFTWPLDQMPGWVQAFAALFPSTPALLALRVLSVKGGGIAAVTPYLLWMAGLFLLYLAGAVTVIRFAAKRHLSVR